MGKKEGYRVLYWEGKERRKKLKSLIFKIVSVLVPTPQVSRQVAGEAERGKSIGKEYIRLGESKLLYFLSLKEGVHVAIERKGHTTR
jgi:hypothetical protein